MFLKIKIYTFLATFFFISFWVSQTSATEVNLWYLWTPYSMMPFYRIWDAFSSSWNTCWWLCQSNYIQNWWYFAWNYAPWWKAYITWYNWLPVNIVLPYFNNSTTSVYTAIKIETETFVYYLIKYTLNPNAWTSTDVSQRLQNFIAYDKFRDKFYVQNSSLWTYWHNNSPEFFFLWWQLHFKFTNDTQWYKFQTDYELWIWIVPINLLSYSNLQSLVFTHTSWQNSYNFTSSDNSNSLYYLNWLSLSAYTFNYDPDLWYLRTNSSVNFPYNPLSTSFSPTSVAPYNIILKDWKIYISMLRTNLAYYSTTPWDTSNLKLWTFEYNPNWWIWTYFDDIYLYHYNHFNWHWWSTNRQKMIDENLQYTRFWLMKFWFWSETANAYKKVYMKKDNYIYTNDTVFIDTSETDWDWAVEEVIYWDWSSVLNTWTWTITTTTTSPDLSENDKWFWSWLLDWITWWLNDIKDSIMWTWSTSSWIEQPTWNGFDSFSWTILNTDWWEYSFTWWIWTWYNNLETDTNYWSWYCRMFNENWTFIYYSNWEWYTFDLNLSSLVPNEYLRDYVVVYVDKLVNIFLIPFNNTISIIRSFAVVDNNTDVCLFWFTKTIEFQWAFVNWSNKVNYIWQWDFNFVEWKMNFYDYFALFIFWLIVIWFLAWIIWVWSITSWWRTTDFNFSDNKETNNNLSSNKK